MKIQIISIVILLYSATTFSQCFQSATASKKGVFTIEAESVNTIDGWTEHTTGDFTRMVYLEWTAEDHFNDPGSGIISYPIHVTEPGTFTFFMRCKAGIGEDPKEHNDCWLRFPDADATFAVNQTTADTIRPRGICTDDCPNGEGGDGWYRLYSDNTVNWTWTSRTSDNDPHEIRVRFETAGLFHIEISGRSNGYFIDKMLLFPQYLSLKDVLLF